MGFLEKIADRLEDTANALMGTQGRIRYDSLLVANAYMPIDVNQSVEFSKAHPVSLFPNLYKKVDSRKIRNKCVTTAYVTYLALMHQTDATGIGDFKYHDSGTGSTAENASDTGLISAWGGSRDIGTQSASTNTYTSVATTTYDNSYAIVEHGLFNGSSSGTLMDRSVFSALNVTNGMQIEWTYTITFTAGG